MHTLDENFSYGYDGEVYNLRSGQNSHFECHYQRASYRPSSFKEECIRVCDKISQYAVAHGRDPVILLSGGLDSEVVLRSFVEHGKPFRVVANRFLNDLNIHEIDQIKRLEMYFGIEVEYQDLDVANWLLKSDQSYIMAVESQCLRPEMLPTMKLIDLVWNSMNGVPVLGNGDLYLSKDINPHWRLNRTGSMYVWNYVEYEYILAWMRYCVKKQIVGSINFFQQTPEIVVAMAENSLIQELVKENTLGKHSSRSVKYQVYKQYWPDIDLRPKHHGGELFANLCDYIRKDRLNKINYQYNSRWKMPLDQFLDMLI